MPFDRHLLVRLFGFRGAFLHGDPMVWDRWRFLRRFLPLTRNGETLLDAGCGSGAFTLGAGIRGYAVTGLSWDEVNQGTAQTRAGILKLPDAQFPICDLRQLNQRAAFRERFDVVVNCENIEHILDDRKLMHDLAACLKPGGYALMTAPYRYYHPLAPADSGPFLQVEDGGHVRRGYSQTMFAELATDAGLVVERFDSCSGPISQLLSSIGRRLGMLGWLLMLPFRPLQPLDRALMRLFNLHGYSICMVAYKPRFAR
ncbi:MAG: class I SAM-dependent methyltransferase [Sphingomicrobium sp.]